MHWNDMTNAQRQASALNVLNVVWDGPQVTDVVPDVLGFGVPQLVVNSPGSIAGNYAAGAAAFGPPLTSARHHRQRRARRSTRTSDPGPAGSFHGADACSR